jgi:hypothetical protein
MCDRVPAFSNHFPWENNGARVKVFRAPFSPSRLVYSEKDLRFIKIFSDSLIRATVNYRAFFKLQEILLEFKNEGVLWGLRPRNCGRVEPRGAKRMGDTYQSIEH